MWKYIINHNFKENEFKTHFKFIKNTTVKVSKNVCCFDCGLIGGFKSFHVVLPIVPAEET